MEHSGYKYHLNKVKGETRYYNCTLRRKGCKGMLRATDGIGFFIIVTPHNHNQMTPEEVKIEESLSTFKNSLKNCAADEQTSLKVIYDREALRNTEASVHYPWPTAEELMKKHRRKSLPAIPKDLQDLSDLFCEGNEIFLNRFECHPAESVYKAILGTANKQIVFGCYKLIEMVGQGDCVLAIDATFKVVPAKPKSTQLITVCVLKEKKIIPIAFSLAEKKTETIYVELLTYIKTVIAPELQPSFAISDFEVGIQNALSWVYPGTKIVGCWFHYLQALNKKIRRLKLNDVAKSDKGGKLIKMAMAVPLLPSHFIVEAVRALKVQAEIQEINLEPFWNYLTRYWINRVGVNNLSVFNSPYRTNNSLERFHLELKRQMGIHPNIFKFIDCIKNLLKTKIIELIQIDAGLPTARPSNNRRYSTNNSRIQNLQQQVINGDITIGEFLRKCAYTSGSIFKRHIMVDDTYSEDDDFNDQVADLAEDSFNEDQVEIPIIELRDHNYGKNDWWTMDPRSNEINEGLRDHDYCNNYLLRSNAIDGHVVHVTEELRDHDYGENYLLRSNETNDHVVDITEVPSQQENNLLVQNMDCRDMAEIEMQIILAKNKKELEQIAESQEDKRSVSYEDKASLMLFDQGQIEYILEELQQTFKNLHFTYIFKKLVPEACLAIFCEKHKLSRVAAISHLRKV